MIAFLNLLGVAVFAVAGALAAVRRGLDVFGVGMIAIVTAIGGGTLRDLLLGVAPVGWVREPDALLVASAAGLVTFFWVRHRPMPERLLNLADAAGLALFTGLGCAKAQASGAHPLVVPVMGMLTGAAGGVLRDVLCAEVPLIFRREVYATAAILGGCAYVVLFGIAGADAALLAAVALTLVVRLAAIRWHLNLPTHADGAHHG